MKSSNDIEVIIVSDYSSSDMARLVEWVATTLQSIVKEQTNQTKGMFIGTLKDAPAFFLS